MKNVLLLLALISLIGCEDITSANQQKTKPATHQQIAHKPIHRFVQFNFNPGVAFDTQTGQICRTWDWKPMGPEPKPNNEGQTPQRSLGEFSPECSYLYLQYSSQLTQDVEDETPNPSR